MPKPRDAKDIIIIPYLVKEREMLQQQGEFARIEAKFEMAEKEMSVQTLH